MRRVEHESFAKRVCQFYCENNRDRLSTYHHFASENRARKTIYQIIERFEERGNIDFKPIPGDKRRVRTNRKIEQVQREINKNPAISDRKLAAKLGISTKTLGRIKKELNVKSYVKEKAPKYIKDQEIRAKRGARAIYNEMLRGKIIVMDDETYVHFDPSEVPGKKFYKCLKKDTVPDKFRFDSKTKFPKKYLVWQAIDSEGNVSEPFIGQGTITANVCIKILKNYLIPFIEKYHSRDEILFWPDLAPAHYAKVAQAFYEAENINFVARNMNPPNLPQGRPIERFWALCKQKYSERSEIARSFHGFVTIWKNISKKVAEKSGQKLMDRLKNKLRSISREGVLAPLKEINRRNTI